MNSILYFEQAVLRIYIILILIRFTDFSGFDPNPNIEKNPDPDPKLTIYKRKTVSGSRTDRIEKNPDPDQALTVQKKTNPPLNPIKQPDPHPDPKRIQTGSGFRSGLSKGIWTNSA